MEEKKKMFDVRKEQERFLTDPIISAFDGLLVRVHMVAMPTYVVFDNRIIEKKYDLKTQALIENIEKERDGYIEMEYGISRGDEEWQ